MKKLLVAGNWKSNKITVEAEDWLGRFNIKYQISNIKKENITIILFPPFTLLPVLKKKIKEFGLPLFLGAQDVSPFEGGAYTGEVNARQIKELGDWVIIGHSERRQHLGETDELLAKKVAQARDEGLKIIYCVPDDVTVVPANVDVVAYEPLWAIGTGKSDSPENASRVIVSIKEKTKVAKVIYGGSVTADNVASFVFQQSIDGVLPGGASLDPDKFTALIENAIAVSS